VNRLRKEMNDRGYVFIKRTKDHGSM